MDSNLLLHSLIIICYSPRRENGFDKEKNEKRLSQRARSEKKSRKNQHSDEIHFEFNGTRRKSIVV